MKYTKRITQYIIKVGHQYYHWNRRLEKMTLVNDIEYAHIYGSYEEAKQDIDIMVEHGNYKNKKKTILKAEFSYEEVEQ